METQGWLVFVLVCGFVWGGFVSFLVLGLRREAAKNRSANRS